VANGLLLSLFVSAMGFAVIIVSDDPTGDPNVTYMIEMMLVLFITLNVSVRLTLPKLRLIWRGEKVVVSQILQDHRRKIVAKSTNQTNISGLDQSYTNGSVLDQSHTTGNNFRVSVDSLGGSMDGDGSHNVDGRRRNNALLASIDEQTDASIAEEVVPLHVDDKPAIGSRLIVIEGQVSSALSVIRWIHQLKWICSFFGIPLSFSRLRLN